MKGVFYFFVKKDKCGAKLIRWGTKLPGQSMEDTPSHMGIVMNGKWSIDSTMFSGVEMDYFPEYIKEYKEVAIYQDTEETRNSSEVAAELMTRARRSTYDWKAILYFAWRKACHKFLKVTMPQQNKWEDPNSWFCNEIYEIVKGKDYSMASPNDVMQEMEKSNRFAKIKLEDLLLAK